MTRQISRKAGASRPTGALVDLGYTRPPMDDKEKEALLEAAKAIPAYYATNLRVRTSVHDISIFFSRSLPVDAAGAEAEEAACIVSMSPALMMSLYRILERHVRIYQEKHKVNLPDVLTFSDDAPDPKPEKPDAP